MVVAVENIEFRPVIYTWAKTTQVCYVLYVNNKIKKITTMQHL